MKYFIAPVIIFLTNVSIIYTAETGEPGLLFYLSGDKGFTADFAEGNPEPSFLENATVIHDGVRGLGLRVPNYVQNMAYFAPGNIYAERGTLSFFWRSREPVGETPFHIFQVSYCDHSSLDMAWLRLDWNGGGYDAFVTDINLCRVRVSYRVPDFPKPDKWTHFAVAWDELEGIRLYIDGSLVARKDTAAVFYAGLDQFGAHNRFINPQHIWSNYNHIRGGDFDEIRIYDRMLSPENIAGLANGESAGFLPPVTRSLNNDKIRDEWWNRYGWNRPDNIPPYLDAPATCVRKIEIHDVYDFKQWVWKGTDGIRETTWPYVYNRSRLPGRTDYFIEPDWNCYSGSGKSVTFFMPDEFWNYLEITGAAYGSLSFLEMDKETARNSERFLFDRFKGRERTFHRLDKPLNGGRVRFDNKFQETPISEFQAYNVTAGQAPEGTVTLTYFITAGAEPDNPCLDTLVDYIKGRFLPDERSTVVALPRGAPRNPLSTVVENPLPVVHILIPCDFRIKRPFWTSSMFSYTWENIYDGLDGIAIDLPALDVKPTHGGYFPMNIQVKDPLWPGRNMIDFSFSVKPGEARTLWLDTRDRILPNDRSFYLTIAGLGQDFGPSSLEGARVRLVFKERKEARKEHEADRYIQVVDNYSNIVECHPNTKKFRMFDRFHRDITDLLRVNPDHQQARYYWSITNGEQGWPPFEQPKAPPGVPLWAFRQVENMKLLRQFILWWIDERQIENGEFGGGLSDDGDMTNMWPGSALMGIEPEKITGSVLREMEAFYENNMFTNGLSTIRTDELHSYEEGINVLPQTMLLDYGDPKVVERLMKTAKAYELITGINERGERQINTTFFSGTKFARDGVWSMSIPYYSHLLLHPGLALVEYNGHPAAKKLLLELADCLLAHGKKDTNGVYYLPGSISFPSGEERGRRGLGTNAHLFWAAWRWTGDKKYIRPLLDSGYGILGRLNANALDALGQRKIWGREIVSRVTPRQGSDLYRHIAWQVTGNKQYLEECYAGQIQTASQRMKMYTGDHWWTDRVHSYSRELQRARLGGIALVRSAIYPGHNVSWKFAPPATSESVAILIPDASPESMTIIVFNLENTPVTAVMTGWDIEPGKWEVTESIDNNGDDIPDAIIRKRTVNFERTGELELTFSPKKTTIVRLKLKSGAKPYWKRPDLGIGRDDVLIEGNTVKITVHSLGSVDAPSSTIALIDAGGKTIATASVPAIKAPLDYLPKTAEITMQVPPGTPLSGLSVCIEPEGKIREITTRNNVVKIP